MTEKWNSHKERQVACPNCYQMNHYNATRCAYCLGDTYRTETGATGDDAYVPSTVSVCVQIALITLALAYFFGATAAAVWLGFWIVFSIVVAVGFGRILVFGAVGLAIWIWLF